MAYSGNVETLIVGATLFGVARSLCNTRFILKDLNTINTSNLNKDLVCRFTVAANIRAEPEQSLQGAAQQMRTITMHPGEEVKTREGSHRRIAEGNLHRR